MLGHMLKPLVPKFRPDLPPRSKDIAEKIGLREAETDSNSSSNINVSKAGVWSRSNSQAHAFTGAGAVGGSGIILWLNVAPASINWALHPGLDKGEKLLFCFG